MKKSSKFFLIDSALLGLLAATGISGLCLWFVVPRGTVRGLRWLLRDIHKWSGIGLIGSASYHLLLHWNWFTTTGANLIGGKNK